MSQPFRITIIAAALVLFAVQCASFFFEGKPDFQTRRLDGFREIATTTSRFAQSVRTGDVIDYRRMSMLARTAWLFESRAGETISFPVRRDGREVDAVVTFVPQQWAKRTILGVFLPALIWKVVAFVLAVFALVRGRGLTALYFGLYILTASISGNVQFFGAAPLALRAWVGVVVTLIFLASLLYGTLMIDSLCLGVVSRRFRIGVWSFIGGMLVTLAVAGFYDDFIGPLLFANSNPLPIPLPVISIAIVDLSYAYCAVGYARSTGLLHYRLAWLFWASLIAFIGGNVALLPGSGQDIFGVGGILANTTIMIAVAGYAYAILRHHIIDVKFVVNKALLYTILTAMIVAVLSISESAIERSTLAHSEGIALEVAVPLILGLVAFRLHAILEKVLDFLFYRRRHIAESELRELLQSAPDIEDEHTLIDAVVSKVQTAIGKGEVALYEMHDGDMFCIKKAGVRGFPSRISHEDSVVAQIALKVTEVDLRRTASALHCSGYAFGMRVKGRVFGALVCCRSEEEPVLDSGERRLLQDIARELALELYAVRLSPEPA